MGSIGDKLLLPFKMAGDLVEQPVNRPGEMIEFIARAPVGESVAQPGWPELIG